MVEESGGQIAKVAKELGIYESSLGNWVRQARAEAEGAPTASERAEIRELKRELERVTRERDILGKRTWPGGHGWVMRSWRGRLLTSTPTGASSPAKSMTLELIGNR